MKSEITESSFLWLQSISTETMQPPDYLELNEESADVAWADSQRRQQILHLTNSIHPTEDTILQEE